MAQEKVQEPAPTFQSKVNLVLVPVVVRDSHGRPVGHLKKDDFQLFDRGEKQTIVSFSAVEHARGKAGQATNSKGASPAQDPGQQRKAAEEESPKRNFLYLFDDVNIRFADMATLRAASVRHFKNNLAEGDCAAVFTMSGNPTLDFTSDREQLEAAVSKLRWGGVAGRGGMRCPDINYYIADLVVTKADTQALAGLVSHTGACTHAKPEIALQIAMAAANQELIDGARNTENSLRSLRTAIRRLTGMAGQNVIVLSSPGFFAQTPEAIRATAEVLDLAAKSNVIISGLSARGVILAEEEQDVSGQGGGGRRPPSQFSPGQTWMRYRRESARANGDIMRDLAEGTGGIFFHDQNDLLLGLQRVSDAPEFTYVLGFSRSELKADGSFHPLKVRLPNEKGVKIEARRGYYALKPGSKGSAEEVEGAIFSREERTDIPVVLQTGYTKTLAGGVAKVMVVAKVDVASFSYKKERDSLSGAVALFDSDGGYVAGTSNTVEIRLPDQLVEKDPALTMRWELPDIKPGAYVVRLVIQEERGKAITTITRELKIL